MTYPDPLPQTELLSPEEKRIYKVGYLDALSEAAEIANSRAKKMRFISAAYASVVEIRDAILSRIKELEKEL